jgi:flagellar basal-body rod modification protein FlgD
MYSDIPNLGAVTGGGTEGITQGKEQEMGKDDFLKLLVAQMKNQDPMNPSSNEDLVMQLAQFSSIEQTQNMNESLGKFIDTDSMSTAGSLIGQEIEAGDPESGDIIKGVVSQVNISPQGTKVVVNGRYIDLDNIITLKGYPGFPIVAGDENGI